MSMTILITPHISVFLQRLPFQLYTILTNKHAPADLEGSLLREYGTRALASLQSPSSNGPDILRALWLLVSSGKSNFGENLAGLLPARSLFVGDRLSNRYIDSVPRAVFLCTLCGQVDPHASIRRLQHQSQTARCDQHGKMNNHIAQQRSVVFLFALFEGLVG